MLSEVNVYLILQIHNTHAEIIFMNILTDAEFCCDITSPSDTIKNTSSYFQGYPGRSHSRGPLKLHIFKIN